MPTDLPSTTAVIDKIHATLMEFCRQCADWEGEFERLLTEFDQLKLFPPRPANGANGAMELLEQRIQLENGQLMDRQDSISRDLAELRKLVLDQTEAFTAFANAGGVT